MKARLPQGFGGGPGNMQSMLRQAQKMQEQMEQTKAVLEEQEYTATAGGGGVEVVMSGKKELKSIKLAPEIVDPEDLEMLEDLIAAAVNEVIRKVEDTSNEAMEKITGKLPLPGMF